jgi:class 3 adenylate cyclase
MALLPEAIFVITISAVVNHSERVRWRQHRLLGDELIRLRRILADLIPAHIAETMADPVGICSVHSELPRERCRAAVLQLDICGFTALSQTMSPIEVARLVHRLFSRFDIAVHALGLFKMDTVGDAYIVAGFLPPPLRTAGDDSSHLTDQSRTYADEERHADQERGVCERLLKLGEAILEEMDICRKETGMNVHGRIGVAIGPVVVGSLGRLQPRIHVLGKVLAVLRLPIVCDPTFLIIHDAGTQNVCSVPQLCLKLTLDIICRDFARQNFWSRLAVLTLFTPASPL